MSEPSSETNPQILVNGTEEEQQQQQEEVAAEAEEQTSSVSLDEENSKEAEKERKAKMQTVFQQVRNQIRSQSGTKAPKTSIADLMQRVKDLELAQVNGKPEGKEEDADESKDEMDLKLQDQCAVFDTKLEESKKALRDEFEVQISQVRAEMQAYTDQALKDLQCKMQSRQTLSPDRRQRPSVPPSLAPRRGRVLTRTMTTIIPKTCAPIIVGPRAKSETLSSSVGQSSRLLQRDPVLPGPGNKSRPSRKSLLPPACPPVNHEKPVRPKARTEN